MTREEAIKIVKEFINGTCLHLVDQEALETLIPELAESEDERMIREIKRYIKEQGDKPNGLPNGTVSVSDMIAWLEKQKYNRMQPVYDNQESFESALDKAWKSYNECGSRTVDSFEDDYIECAHAKGFREGYLFGLEKQKENIEKEYVFRPLAGTDITIAAEQAIRIANEGDRLVLAFNGAYIPVRKGYNVNKIVDIYDSFIEKQKEGSKSTDSVPSVTKCEYEWHKVTDSLPDSKRLVLAKDSFGNVLLTRYDGSWMVNVYDSEDYYTHNSITEWCDIPKDTHYAYLRGLIKWSEEDERMRQTAIEACKVVINDYENSNSRFYKCKDWLENKLVEKI